MLILSITGFKTSEAITGLRATQNNISDAVNFISDRRKKLQEAREVGKKERDLKTSIENLGFDPEEVNIRSLHNLVQMGFQKDLCALALQKSRNDVPQAVSLKIICLKPLKKSYFLYSRLLCCKTINLNLQSKLPSL